MAYATIADVAKTLGRPIDDSYEIDQVNDWILDTELVIKERLGDLSTLDPDTLRSVIKEAVARRVKNPDGKANERIDDYSYSLVEDAKKVGIWITDEEWARLAPTTVATGVGQVMLGGAPGYACSDRGWWL